MVDGLHRQWFEPWDRRGRREVPLVLLHEGLGSVSAWRTFPQSLADVTHRRVLAYDRPGYGRSPAPDGDGPWPARFLHDAAAGLLDLLAAEGVAEVIPVGHSDGASTALLAPSQAPDDPARFPGIVSLSAHVLVEDRTVAAIADLRRQVAEGDGGFLRLLGQHHDDAATVFERWSEVWLSDRFRPWDIGPELAEVGCPVLAVQGDADAYGTRLQLDRLVAAVSGPVEVDELPGVDHWPHREATEHTLALVTAFCDRLAP